MFLTMSVYMCALTIRVDTYISVWVYLVGTYALNLGMYAYASCCHSGTSTSFCLLHPHGKMLVAYRMVLLLGSADLLRILGQGPLGN